ncbi:hypothetical protein D3C81_1070960 [compost metagenome]
MLSLPTQLLILQHAQKAAKNTVSGFVLQTIRTHHCGRHLEQHRLQNALKFLLFYRAHLTSHPENHGSLQFPSDRSDRDPPHRSLQYATNVDLALNLIQDHSRFYHPQHKSPWRLLMPYPESTVGSMYSLVRSR